MISDLELVNACAATYTAAAPTLPLPKSGAWCNVSRGSDGMPIVAFRGSVTPQDWLRDFIFEPVTARQHPQLGRCHAGFLTDAESIVEEVDGAVGAQAFYLTGHSLGGALAVGVGALLMCRGKMANAQTCRIVTFGAPRFGMADFVKAIAPLDVRQYVRGNDLVPDLPEDDPPLFSFLDSRDPRVAIGAIVGRTLAARVACHHIAGYVADVGAYLIKTAA